MSSGSEAPDPGPRAVREATIIATSGAVVFVFLVAGFSLRLGFGLIEAIFLALLLELLPALSLAQLPLAGHVPVERLAVYLQSTALLAFIGSTALLIGFLGPGLGAMGLETLDAASALGWVAALATATALIHVLSLQLTRRTPLEESALVMALLPRTSNEKRAFAAVSVVAGVNEEVAFRGYAIPVLAPLLGGPWVAAGFTSALFGLLHGYQGLLGIARTTLLGMLFAASFVLSGSLWPAIATHVAVDLFMGLGPGRRLLGSAPDEGESHATDGDG